MSTDHWETARAAADLLLAAWRDPLQALAALPDPLRPQNMADANAIQQAVMSGLGRIGGWKVGPSPLGGYACAPLPLDGLHGGTAHLSARAYTLRGIEAEIAVRLSRDLEARDTPYTRQEILDAIDTCHPAIEVLQSRFRDPDAQDPLSLLADLGSHGCLVYGHPWPDWQGANLAREGVRVLADGQEVARGTGNPAGDMIAMLQWLAAAGARWAGGLRVGQVVTTGSWTGRSLVGPRSSVRVLFTNAGEAAVTFSEEGVGT